MPSTPPGRAQTVEQATGLFWRHGYDETSVEDIVKATGLNRYAIYNQFGGKRELLLAALDGFFQQRKQTFIELLEDTSMKPLQAIRHMFASLIEQIVQSGNGCLMCNTFSDVAPKDPQVAEVCQKYQTEFTDFVGAVLKQAQAGGDMRADLDPGAAAQSLMTLKIGLAVRAKAGAPRGALLDVVDAYLNAISNTRRQK